MPRRDNLILRSLGTEDRRRLDKYLERFAFRVEHILHAPGTPIDYVYFPESGMFSSTVSMEDGGTVEVGGTGYEGLVGIPVFYGETMPAAEVMCEMPGDVLALRIDRFRQQLVSHSGLWTAVARYAFALSVQTMQLAACNRLHGTDARLARWLLMTHDRVGADRFPLTQQFLAFMLGVHRPNVTVVARALQQAGFIAYRRGIVSMRDRQGLEQSACECYRIISDGFGPLRPRHDSR